MPAADPNAHEYTYATDVPFNEPPQRVVSLVPSLTESLFELNLGERVVGITDYCIYPAEALVDIPRVGGPKTPDLDAIIELKPDVVLMDRDENRLADAEKLTAAGVTVWATHPKTVQEALNLLWDIMYAFDEPAMVERVRWIERQRDWTDGVARENQPVKVFAPIWYAPWMTFNQDTYAHDILRICGGINVFAQEADRFPRITIEAIMAAQPEVILLPDEPFVFGEAHVAEVATWDIPAAHNQRIHLVDGTLLTWHGTRIARALNELPALLASEDRDS
jgi:ABC-type Fe3+-hydroxamate transport system substrate-binding protein